MRKNCCTKRKKSIDYDFEAAWDRLQKVVGSNRQEAIATAIDVTQPSVSWAFNQRRIPDKWLLHLLRTKLINPDWILYGEPYCQRLSYEKTDHKMSFHEKADRTELDVEAQKKEFELVMKSFNALTNE